MVEAAFEHYLDSDATRAPVVIAGRGAVQADAREALEGLAERLDAFLATTLQARGYFEDHPFSVGFTGDLGSPLANEKLTEADFVFAAGCSLNPHTHDSGNLVRDGAKTVHVDTDPTSIGRYLDVDLAIHGDAGVTAREFTRLLEDRGVDRSGEFRTEDARRRIADSSPLSDREFEVDPGRMDPRVLARSLDELLPRDRLVVTDAGHFATWVLDGITVRHPDEFVWTLDFTAIGQGLAIGIGAALSGAERNCVTVCGDAGFMMALQEVETAARHGAPITVVVMNDSTLGAEYHQAKNAGFSGDVARIDTPDIAALAERLGAEGYTVRSESDLEAVRDVLGGSRTGPVVLDCRIDPDVRHRVYGG
jgi:thiamine pyrophosphate-dependent acetolactate synthase large subunit-like protein